MGVGNRILSDINCSQCGKIFRPRRATSKVCSTECAKAALKGRSLSASHKLSVALATKAAMQRPEVQAKIHKEKNISPESKKRTARRLSNHFKGKTPANLRRPGKYGNVIRGWYNINGKVIFLRSKWEANYAVYLDYLISRGQVVSWEYEVKRFIFEKIQFGTRSYEPDFKVTFPDGHYEWHEIKGWMTRKSKTQLKRMAKYFPDEIIFLVEKPQYTAVLDAMKSAGLPLFGPGDCTVPKPEYKVKKNAGRSRRPKKSTI